jgi:hypothetical protein
MKNIYRIILIASLVLNVFQLYSSSTIGNITEGNWKATGENNFYQDDLLGFVDDRVNCEFAYSVDVDGNIFLNDKKVGHLEWIFFGRIKIVDNGGKAYYYKQI